MLRLGSVSSRRVAVVAVSASARCAPQAAIPFSAFSADRALAAKDRLGSRTRRQGGAERDTLVWCSRLCGPRADIANRGYDAVAAHHQPPLETTTASSVAEAAEGAEAPDQEN